MRSLLQILLMMSIFIMSAKAERDVPTAEMLKEAAQPKTPKSLKDLDQQEFLLDGTIWERFERIEKRKFIHCMKALPHERFCRCLASALPVAFGMDAYVKILINSRKDIGYDNMTDEMKNAVDSTIQAREECASNNL